MISITTALELSAIEKLRSEDLEEARTIQGSMLPLGSLRSGTVKITHEFRPVAGVGGDYLDYFELSDGNVGLYLGDVSGKGLPAAMYAALAVGTLRGVHKTGESPGQVLSLLNKRLLLRGVPRRYTAIQYAVFHPQSRELQVASAGMLGPIHISRGGCKVLKLPGIPPGLFATAEYQDFKLRLEPGDSVLFCTDGITDARNLEGSEFGAERLEAMCGKEVGTSPAGLLVRIFSAVDNFSRGTEQHDDMAAALLHCAG